MRELALLSPRGAGNGRTGKNRRNDQAARATPRRIHARQHYFAFLSYSHADQAMAEWLQEAIESFRVPRRLVGRLTENGVVPRRLTPIFRDRGELAAADDLTEEIEEALAGSRFMVVLCSPAAVASRWANAEIVAFKRLHPAGEIFAAIVAGEPFASDMPGREAEECFPPALLENYDSRGRPTGKRAEPIAADLRGDAEAKRLGLMQIIAGMLGVGLDELVQREGKRRQRRVQIIFGALLAGMIFTSGMSLWAIQSRDAARDQRREAESLVAFMLGDLRDKLEPIGELDALGGVGSRVLDYYSKQDTSELSDEGLVQRAQALNLMGHVANLRGEKETASQLYRQAMQGTAEAVRRRPDDPQRLFDHAQNVFYVGEIARDMGDPRQAEAFYREYKRLADEMVALEPNNLRWRMEGLYAQENIGIVLRTQRRFAEARRIFLGTLQPMQALASVEADKFEYQKELSTLLAWAADAESDVGNLDAAVRLRERQVSFLGAQIRRGDRNVTLRRELIPARQGLGILYVASGQNGRGIEQFQLAVAEVRRLIPIEPDNMLWKGLGASAWLQFASTMLSSGRFAEAAAETSAACRLANEVVNREKSGAWQRLATDCLRLRSRLALQSGDAAAASGLADRALASTRAERGTDAVGARYRIAAALRVKGDALRRMGDGAAARAAWNAGLAQLPNNAAERPVEMAERAALMARLGRQEDARKVADRLAAIGYRQSL